MKMDRKRSLFRMGVCLHVMAIRRLGITYNDVAISNSKGYDVVKRWYSQQYCVPLFVYCYSFFFFFLFLFFPKDGVDAYVSVSR